MKRFKWFIAFTVILALFVATPAPAALQDMYATVHRWTGGMNGDGTMKLERIESGITFRVMSHGTATVETTYYPGKTTALTNPVTTTSFASATICNKQVAFRVDPTDATDDRYVDLLVVDTAGGYTAFVDHFDKYTHTIVIDERPNVVHQGTFWFTAGSTSVINTGIAFIPGTLIQDVRIEVITACAAASIHVGILAAATGGDTDGFRANVLLTTTGWVTDTGVATSGVSTDYTPASTYGALLFTAVAGSATFTATARIPSGGRTYIGHIITTETSANQLVYSASTSVTTGNGFIHYWFSRGR